MTSATPVTLLGTGQMGSALGHSFLATGHPLTVWNRTASKCAPLHDAGASVAATPAAAAAAGDLVVVCVLDYATANAFLRTPETEGALAGRTLIQLSTGTAADAREMLSWASAAGIVYLDGAIFGLPGAEGCRIFCSGPVAAFARCRGLLAGPAGEALHVGENISDANTLDEAILICYEGTLFSYLQAAAFCDAEEVPLDRFEALAAWLHDRYGPHVIDALAPVHTRAYEVSVETPLSIWTAAIGQQVRATRESGIEPMFAEALLHIARKGMGAGFSDREFSAAFEGFRSP